MKKAICQKISIFLIFIFPLAANPMFAPTDRYNLKDWECFQSHQGFYPYPCELGYRTLANHVIDPNHMEFDPANVKKGDIIYVAVWFLDWFIEHVHDKIPNPYILVTCDVGSYLPNPSHCKLLYDPKVVFWFAKNMMFTNHPKLFQLPMGQFYYLWAHGISQVIHKLNELVSNLPNKKDYLLYLNFTERDHGRRIVIADKFWNEPYCFNRNRPRKNTNFEQFWDEVSRSKFVLSPLGLEVDCTRTWECFILGSIPIVEHSYLDPIYEKLPILLVYNWDEVNEEYLNKKYKEIKSKSYQFEKAYLDYWINLLHEKQNDIINGKSRLSAIENSNFTDEEIILINRILRKNGGLFTASDHKCKKNKLDISLVYIGNFTCLRPYQIANLFRNINIYLYDMWTKQGFEYIMKFCRNPELLNNTRVKICNSDNLWNIIANKKHKFFFIDLTHFRHSLFVSLNELSDYSHGLENNILNIYINLEKGGVIFGNMSNDPYVMKVINKMQERGLTINTKDNFWYCARM